MFNRRVFVMVTDFVLKHIFATMGVSKFKNGIVHFNLCLRFYWLLCAPDEDLKHKSSVSFTKTCLYNFDPLKPHFYTGVYRGIH